MPVFVANGDSDPMILPHFSHLLAGLIPQARVKIYRDAAHGFLFQHPLAVRQRAAQSAPRWHEVCPRSLTLPLTRARVPKKVERSRKRLWALRRHRKLASSPPLRQAAVAGPLGYLDRKWSAQSAQGPRRASEPRREPFSRGSTRRKRRVVRFAVEHDAVRSAGARRSTAAVSCAKCSKQFAVCLI